MTRQIEYVPLDDLRPDPRNPKGHDGGTIRSSIDRFGVADTIVRDDRTGYIVSGHGRREALLAMREAGQSPPDGVTDDWQVPVTTGWASRSDNEAAAALIALNRTTELGGWQDDELISLLADLSEVEDGLDGVGFSVEDLDDLRQKLDEDEAFEPDRSTVSPDFTMYQVVVNCTDPEHQERVLMQLMEMNLDVTARSL